MLMEPTGANSGELWLVELRYVQATQTLPPLLAGSDHSRQRVWLIELMKSGSNFLKA